MQEFKTNNPSFLALNSYDDLVIKDNSKNLKRKVSFEDLIENILVSQNQFEKIDFESKINYILWFSFGSFVCIISKHKRER